MTYSRIFGFTHTYTRITIKGIGALFLELYDFFTEKNHILSCT